MRKEIRICMDRRITMHTYSRIIQSAYYAAQIIIQTCDATCNEMHLHVWWTFCQIHSRNNHQRRQTQAFYARYMLPTDRLSWSTISCQQNKLPPCVALLFAKRERSRIITASLSYNYGTRLILDCCTIKSGWRNYYLSRLLRLWQIKGAAIRINGINCGKRT